jgi:hypothetical protein
MFKISPAKLVATGAVAGALSLAGFGIASASIPSANGTFYGCVKGATSTDPGALIVKDDGGTGDITCGTGATKITWSQGGAVTVTTATADIPPFDGGNQPTATAQCPTGTVASGGGATLSVYGQILMESAPSSDGTGWVGSFTAGPVGYGATVYARCVAS